LPTGLPGPFGLVAWLLVVTVVVTLAGVLVELGLWPGSTSRTERNKREPPPPS